MTKVSDRKLGAIGTRLQQDCTRLSVVAEPIAEAVSRDGGHYGNGILHAVSLATRGEAIGHDAWIDDFALLQIHAAVDTPRGIKSRFTHPNMSSDGLGRSVGRFYDPVIRDGRVFADLHWYTSASNTPDGDLKDYILRLAEDDAQGFGLSISFRHDTEAEDAFWNRNMTDGAFVSPDERNERNLMHIRIASLLAADFVDEPAANPLGLFHRQRAPVEATALLDYITELTNDEPDVGHLGVDPVRARQFFRSWLASRQKPIREKLKMSEQTMTDCEADVATEAKADKPQETQCTAEPETVDSQLNTEPVATVGDPGDSREMLRQYTEMFGKVKGTDYFLAGASLQQAQEQHIAYLNARIGELETKLQQARVTGSDPVSVQKPKSEKPLFRSYD